ncbi:ABC transporter permease [Streptomyces sp. NPDC090075]|uniref:ABC transporter permease n=1 Tax=Streptomyces sp. NPDC090075 TaxID=3365937 RepID=UPI0038113CB8
MTTTAADTPTAAGRDSARPAYKVTFAGVIRSEWGKFWSVRSTWITLALAVVMVLAFGIIAAAVFTPGQARGNGPDVSEGAVGLATTGTTFAELALGVLGVMIAASEYTTGMIRATLSAVPRRLPVLWSKSLVLGTAILPLGCAAALGSFWVGGLVLKDTEMAQDISDPGVLRVLIGVGLYLTLVGVWGVALGSLLRSTAGGIAVLVSVLLIVPGLTGLLPSSIRDDVTPYLPNESGQAVTHLHQASDSLGPWAGLAVFAGWVVLTLAGAAYRLAKTDA